MAAGTRKLVPVIHVRRGEFLFLDQRNRKRIEDPFIAAALKTIVGGDCRSSTFLKNVLLWSTTGSEPFRGCRVSRVAHNPRAPD
jgi:hypothetical protein